MSAVVLILFAVISSVYGQFPVVNIAQGSVLGSVSENGAYFEFYGIPYAGSTSGDNRFKAPNPSPEFENNILVADQKDIKCIKPIGVGYEGTEDCLVANVFTPTDVEELLPVVVWVKGREFEQIDEPELIFTNLIEQRVVVVSLNYRESIFGFLCLGTETAPGNAGLKDIVAGLRWVQENIGAFGGRADSVTLMGHGSGAAAVDLVSLSPLSEGLINKVIIQSGSALSPWAVTRDPTKYAIEIAESLGHEITDIEQLSQIYPRVSVAALVAAINELDLNSNELAFAPCIENDNLKGDEKVILESPFEILTSGSFTQIPTLIGYVENEGTININEVLESDKLDRLDDNFADFLQPDLQMDTEETKNLISSEIRSFYFSNASINTENIVNYVRMHGDTMISVPLLREARLRAAFSSETFVYQFSYKGSLGEPFSGPLALDGANHGEELGYLFNTDTESELQQNVIDMVISEILVDRWTNFATTGTPSTQISSNTWLSVTPENTNVLLFRNDDANKITTENLDVLIVNPNQDAVAFWDNIYANYFYDATGSWSPTIRNETEDSVTVSPDDVITVTELPDDLVTVTNIPDDVVTESNIDPDYDETEVNPDNVEIDPENGVGEIEEETPATDAATSLAGSSLIILSLVLCV